jgi:hypothetical protein
MKFGETLYQRSVPKWSAYNVNYNQIKHLIKVRTSAGSALPLSIPSAGVGRWHDLENELYTFISVQYENIALFLRSKQGEIDRRLAHLEKHVQIAKRAVDEGALDRPILQARKYQKLIKDAESIGDEVESLSRFASVQKTAFRKILKKYRKWTGSTALQQRLEVELFSSGALHVDYANHLQRLSTQSTIISTQLAGPMLSGSRFQSPTRGKLVVDGPVQRSNAKQIAEACAEGPLQFDAALSSVPYGEAGGSAYFWIHPDNLEEAEALLLRHMHALEPQSPSAATITALGQPIRQAHDAWFDNLPRYVQEISLSKPSNVALTARWTTDPDSLVTFSSLAPKTITTETVDVRRKDLAKLLQRSSDGAKGKFYKKLHSYLSEHRDVKPLAETHSCRSRYVGNNNTNEIGSWATLDSSILIAPADPEHAGELDSEPHAAEAFPHAIFSVRWEFSRMPEVVRSFQTSHLAEPVDNFSLEKAAIYTVFKQLEQPQWRQLLNNDIRKVPASLKRRGSARNRANDLSSVPASSGPSSTDGPSDSAFSVAAEQSSATSIENSPILSQREQSFGKTKDVVAPVAPVAPNSKTKSKKRTKFAQPTTVEEPLQRYWNEFDDGDSDVHVEETYAIYVDPNEPSFPGADTVARVFGSMYSSISKGSARMISWLPIATRKGEIPEGERTPLLFDGQGGYVGADLDSSGSEIDDPMRANNKHQRNGFHSSSGSFPWNSRRMFRPGQPLSRRQRALETTLFQFYTGLIVLAYLLLMIASILFSTGRKKKMLEVDAGMVAGVVAAEACAGISVVLLCMRRKPLGPVHWGLVIVNVVTIMILGIAELTIMFMGRA